MAVALGVLSVLTMPAAVFATRYSGSYDLVHAAFAIPLGLVTGVLAVRLVRRTPRRGTAREPSTLARSRELLGLAGLWLAGRGARSRSPSTAYSRTSATGRGRLRRGRSRCERCLYNARLVFAIGSSLREARTRQALEFEEMENRTKVRGKYLRMLEEERFDQLPGHTYTKGFLRVYADALGLDGRLYVDEYNSRFVAGDEDYAPRTRRVPPPFATGASNAASRASWSSPCSRSRCSRRW